MKNFTILLLSIAVFLISWLLYAVSLSAVISLIAGCGFKDCLHCPPTIIVTFFFAVTTAFFFADDMQQL